MPVKTGTGGWPPIGADDDGGSDIGADDVDTELEEDEELEDEYVEGTGGSMYPLPLGKGLWPPQKLCNHEEYSCAMLACLSSLPSSPVSLTCRGSRLPCSLTGDLHTLLDVPRDLRRAQHLWCARNVELSKTLAPASGHFVWCRRAAGGRRKGAAAISCAGSGEDDRDGSEGTHAGLSE